MPNPYDVGVRALLLSALAYAPWACSSSSSTYVQLPDAAEDGPPSRPPDGSPSVGQDARDGWPDEPAAVGDESPPFDAGDAAAVDPEPRDGPEGGSCAYCDAYGEPRAIAAIPVELPELSGLAASQRHPDRLYGHNDSGDAARLFAMAGGGTTLAELRLDGAIADDWEDVAVGPCELTTCIFVGDIGDNKLARLEYAIYRVAEPETLPIGRSTQTVSYDRFAFTYPDGPHNAETLLVHPVSGRVYVVTKATDGQLVFELPLPLDRTNRVRALQSTLIAHLPAAAITGGDFHPCGDHLLLRTYGSLFEYRTNAARSFQDEPAVVPVATELQGESVTYRGDGLGYYTASETPAGAAAPSLNLVGCRSIDR